MGIDYGMYTTKNRDLATGIRFGVIGNNHYTCDISEWEDETDATYVTEFKERLGSYVSDLKAFWETPVDGEYGPQPGEYIIDASDELLNDIEEVAVRLGSDELTFETLFDEIDQEFYDQMGDGGGSHDYSYEDEDYSLEMDETDTFIKRSPYVVKAAFCSPCAPGAVSSDVPDDYGAWGYALGPEWFWDIDAEETEEYKKHLRKTSDLLDAWLSGNEPNESDLPEVEWKS